MTADLVLRCAERDRAFAEQLARDLRARGVEAAVTVGEGPADHGIVVSPETFGPYEAGVDALVAWVRARDPLAAPAPAARSAEVLHTAEVAPGLPEPSEAEAPRVADLRLRRLDGDGADLRPDEALRAGAAYELRFRVGPPAAGSLLRGPLPGVDPLLPPLAEGQRHTLEVVVHAQDFTLASPAVATITLGERGASDVATFVVLAPALPAARHRARLRVSVYHQDVLLQSFRLDARVGTEEHTHTRALVARLDYSRTPGFVALDRTTPRFACVSVNDATDGAHDVMVKSGATVGDARIALAQAEEALAAFRATITAMTRDAHGQRYSVGLPPPLPMFAADVYRLAVGGWELAHALFDANPGGVALLAALRDGTDLTLQLVRLSPRLALPWGTLYDWDLPEQTPAGVCLGAHDGAPCGHRPTDGVLCVRGFWGIRHRLEELVDTGREWADRAGSGPRLVAVDAAAPAWATLGAATLPGGFAVLPPDATLIDALDGPARPSVLAILGHHAARGAGVADLSLPRIEVGPASRRLTRKALLERCHTLPKWEDGARPLVLLMACDTAVPLDPYADFVAPLLTKGAVGVVATECIVYPDLAGHVTRRLLELLSGDATEGGGGTSLVDALRTLRLELLRARNPLGFVFTAIGNADLRL